MLAGSGGSGAPGHVELEPGTLVIGDVHLDLADDEAVERFCAWLGSVASAPRLVILGDLFEYWIGPTHARTPGGAKVVQVLSCLVAEGCRVDVVPGNRDFLLDRGFARASGCTVRHDGFVGRLAPTGSVLFVHGDELCTKDRGYLALRRVLRSRLVRWLAPRMPRSLAQALARRLRRASRRALARKPTPAAEQQPDAVEELARHTGVQAVVCGHAHRFRDERLRSGLRWIVVDAFGGERDRLRVDADGALEPVREATA